MLEISLARLLEDQWQAIESIASCMGVEGLLRLRIFSVVLGQSLRSLQGRSSRLAPSPILAGTWQHVLHSCCARPRSQADTFGLRHISRMFDSPAEIDRAVEIINTLAR